MNKIPFQCLESSEQIGGGITREIWFLTTPNGIPALRTLYKTEDGSVAAFQDHGEGLNSSLYVDVMFYDLFKSEEEWNRIKIDSGVYGIGNGKIKFFKLR